MLKENNNNLTKECYNEFSAPSKITQVKFDYGIKTLDKKELTENVE